MKTLLALLALTFTASLSAQSLALHAGTHGVVIEGGTHGRVVLSAPALTGSDKKRIKSVFSPSADGTSATATFPDGFVITVTVSSTDGTITYGFDHVPPAAVSVVLEARLPLSYNDGGSYATNGGEARPFPGESSKQLFEQGAFNRLDLVTGTGEGLSFTMPASYQQLQDNRVWGTQAFSWIYHYDFLRYPDATGFTISVAPVRK